MKKVFVFTVSAVLFVLGMSSCVHKELCYNHAHTVNVNVVFDWRDAPDASPESMSLYMFPSNGQEAIRYDFTERNGGVIRVPIGKYDAICLNSDTKNTILRNTLSANTFEISTRPASLVAGLGALLGKVNNAPMAEGTEDETVASEPEMLWTDHSRQEIELNLTEESYTIVFYPQQSVCLYDVKILNVDNLKYVQGVSGAISGLAGGELPYSDKVTSELVTIPFEATANLEDSSITGNLRTFGYHHESSPKHQLTVYAILSDGSKWYYTYDVTEQIHNAPDPRIVHIVLDGLPLPKPIVNGGGFQPSVGDWVSIDVGINM